MKNLRKVLKFIYPNMVGNGREADMIFILK